MHQVAMDVFVVLWLGTSSVRSDLFFSRVLLHGRGLARDTLKVGMDGRKVSSA